VDPKTLRRWLQAAGLSCCLHPSDARLKCLTLPQLEQLAHLHARCLPSPLPTAAPQAVARPSCAPAPTQPGARPIEQGSSEQDVTEVRQQLRLLQQQVASLQGQVSELALALLRASLAPAHQPTISPPAPLAVSLAPCSPAPPPALAPAPVSASAPPAGPPEPRQARARSRALPLIQVRADGSVVVMAPTEGVLALDPDSAAWFAWLSSLTAFSFEDQLGRFSATRKFRQGQRIQSWNVHRSLHGRSCTLSLGLTPTLTLTRLEDMAAAVHARLTAL
jgi:hypothetical protein